MTEEKVCPSGHVYKGEVCERDGYNEPAKEPEEVVTEEEIVSEEEQIEEDESNGSVTDEDNEEESLDEISQI